MEENEALIVAERMKSFIEYKGISVTQLPMQLRYRDLQCLKFWVDEIRRSVSIPLGRYILPIPTYLSIGCYMEQAL